MTAPVLDISEIFHSVQGEGSRAGEPATFIRLAHCNLACSWCDAAYTWKGDVSFDTASLDDVASQVRHASVVVTGGEPTIAAEFDALIHRLDNDGRHITVETNGTRYPREVVDHVALWSISPKLGSSGQATHLNRDVLLQFLDHAQPRLQLKFVIDTEDDLEDVTTLLGELDIPASTLVYLQPNGLCPMVEYGERMRWLYELVLAHEHSIPGSVRAVPQIHKLAWGNRRGF